MAKSKRDVPKLVKEEVELVFEEDSLETISLDTDEALTLEAPVSISHIAKIAKDLSDIEALITPIDDVIQYLTWVIYGKNGTGKTTLLSTAEGMLILAAEDGTLSIRTKAENARKIKIDSWDKLEAVYWLLNGGKRTKEGIQIKTSSGVFTVKYVAIDTITKLAEICMRNIVLGEKERDASKDLITKTLKDWGNMSEKMKYWLQQFEELPIQRVWLFQESSNSEDVESDEFSIFPAANKSLRTYVMSEADIIARTYIAKNEKGMQYRISAVPNPSYVSKDRTSTINIAPINNPNLSKLYNKIFNSD